MKENYILLAIVKRDYDFKGKDGNQIKGTNYNHYFLTKEDKVEIYKQKEPCVKMTDEMYISLPQVQVVFRKFTNAEGKSEIVPETMTVLN